MPRPRKYKPWDLYRLAWEGKILAVRVKQYRVKGKVYHYVVAGGSYYDHSAGKGREVWSTIGRADDPESHARGVIVHQIARLRLDLKEHVFVDGRLFEVCKTLYPRLWNEIRNFLHNYGITEDDPMAAVLFMYVLCREWAERGPEFQLLHVLSEHFAEEARKYESKAESPESEAEEALA